MSDDPLADEVRRIHLLDQAEAAAAERDSLFANDIESGEIIRADEAHPAVRNVFEMVLYIWNSHGRHACLHAGTAVQPIYIWARFPAVLFCQECAAAAAHLGRPAAYDPGVCDSCNDIAPLHAAIITSGPMTIITYVCANCSSGMTEAMTA